MKRSVSVRVSKWAQIIFIWTVAVVFFAPLCLAVTNSFKPRSEIMASALSLPTSLYLDNYRTVMEDDYLPLVYRAPHCHRLIKRKEGVAFLRFRQERIKRYARLTS